MNGSKMSTLLPKASRFQLSSPKNECFLAEREFNQRTKGEM